MPIPTVVCVICKEKVSRRSTLALSVLGGGEGRACRRHEALATLAQLCAQEADTLRQMTATNRRLRIIGAAAGIRVMCTINGNTAEMLYGRLRHSGFDEPMMVEIRKEVERLGGPTMTTGELGEAVLNGLAYNEFLEKK